MGCLVGLSDIAAHLNVNAEKVCCIELSMKYMSYIEYIYMYTTIMAHHSFHEKYASHLQWIM